MRVKQHESGGRFTLADLKQQVRRAPERDGFRARAWRSGWTQGDGRRRAAKGGDAPVV